VCAEAGGRRHDVSVLPPGIARAGRRVAILTNGGCQTLPAGCRAVGGVGQRSAAADGAYQQQLSSSSHRQYYLYSHQQQQQQQQTDLSDSPAGGRISSPRHDAVVSFHETVTGNSRSAVAVVANGSPGAAGSRSRGRRSRLKTAVSELDIAVGNSSHLSPRGGAITDDQRHLEETTAARLNHVGGIISTSLLALPDTSV